jgi:hypothetical protein
MDGRQITGRWKWWSDRKLTDLSAQKGRDIKKLLCLDYHNLIVEPRYGGSFDDWCDFVREGGLIFYVILLELYRKSRSWK